MARIIKPYVRSPFVLLAVTADVLTWISLALLASYHGGIDPSIWCLIILNVVIGIVGLADEISARITGRI